MRLLVVAWQRRPENLAVLHLRDVVEHPEQLRPQGGEVRQAVLPVVLVNFAQQLLFVVARSADQPAELDSVLFSEREGQQDHPCSEVEPKVYEVAAPDLAKVVSSVVRQQLQVWKKEQVQEEEEAVAERRRAVLLVPAAAKMHSLSPMDVPEPVLRPLVKLSELCQDPAVANIQAAAEAAADRL